MTDRGMKKWLPFNSLIEQKEYIRQIKESKKNELLPDLSEDQISQVNHLLTNYDGQMVNISYILDSKKSNIVGYIKKVDTINGFIIINDKKINIKNLTNVKKI